MKNTLSAAVLLIGNELLSGRVQDLNLSHIAITLEQRGIRVREARIVADTENDIVHAINKLRQQYDYIFTTGGIGPTHDDITSDCIARAFGVENIVQPQSMTALKRYFEQKGVLFTDAAARMGYAPSGAQLFCNDAGIAQGYCLSNVFVLPGVPSIMRNMLEQMLDHLKTGQTILSGTVYSNASESEIAQPLATIQQRHQNVDIGSYPQDKMNGAEYKVMFIVKGTDQEEINDVCQQIELACHDMGREATLV